MRVVTSVALRAQLARHELADCAARIVALEEDPIYRGHDGHVDVLPRSERLRALSGEHAFRDGLAGGERFLELPALTDLESELTVSAQRASARQHQIAHPGQTREGERVR